MHILRTQCIKCVFFSMHFHFFFTFCLTPQVNGNLTLGENIADNGGLKTGYQAFLSLMNTTEQPMLPALNYTPEQLYFIAYGQVHVCRHTYTTLLYLHIHVHTVCVKITFTYRCVETVFHRSTCDMFHMAGSNSETPAQHNGMTSFFLCIPYVHQRRRQQSKIGGAK